MADFFCDHGAYGLASNRLGLDTPAWGIPQEGDGSTKDAATAASIGSIVFASVPTSGVISVCGVTVSTTGVIGAASVTAAADTLATNINATTTTVASGVARGTPQLRNLVYARGPSNGAPAGTCQIMMRIGSSLLNYTTNASAAIASTFTGAPTVVQFAGGSGGCWGWFINPAAIGAASSIAIFSYGAFLALPYVAAATPTITDTVWVRTGGGASKNIVLSFSGSTMFVHAAYSKTLVFDTNTKWTSDVANGQVKVSFTCTGWNMNPSLRWCAINQLAAYIALAPGGLELEYVCAQSQGTFVITEVADVNGTVAAYARNVRFRDSMTTASNGYGMSFTITGNGALFSSRLWENCEYVVTTPRATIWSSLFSMGAYGSQSDQAYTGCTFDFNISGVSDPGSILNNGIQNEVDISFRSCNFKGFASGYSLLTSVGNWATNGTRLSLLVDNCSGLKMPAAYLGLPSATEFSRQNIHQIVFSNAALSSQAGMRIEDNRGVAEWLPDDSTAFPTLAATLPGTGTPYSIRLIWIRAVPLAISRTWRSPDFRMFHQLAAATRTLKLRVLAPSALSSAIKATFGYIDSDGVARIAETEILGASDAVWNNAGNYPGYVAKEFAVTTPYAIKANSEITACVQFFGAPPGSDATVNVYVDPEFVVS